MTPIAPGQRPKVDLIPWDHTSPDHAHRMYLQRVACGWREDEVEKWQALGRDGTKVLYWIILSEDSPSTTSLLTTHTTAYPLEATTLTDTSTLPFLTPRTPSHAPFLPIGHIALDLRPADDIRLGLLPPPHSTPTPTQKEEEAAAPPAVRPVWVAGLYVSFALQRSGLGAAAMRAAERLAAGPPLRGTLAVLDTMPAEEQMQPAFLHKVYGERGVPAPTVSSQSWYERLGYESFLREKDGFAWLNPKTGQREPMSLIYFKKPLT